MDYFTDDEFREWYDRMAAELLVKLDLFRHRWGKPVNVSPVRGALGRHAGPNATTGHNVDKWGEVNAADVLPEGIETRADAERAVRLAHECGFRDIGFYPHWRPSPGLHLGTRPTNRMESPATWGGYRDEAGKQHTNISLRAAIDLMPEG